MRNNSQLDKKLPEPTLTTHSFTSRLNPIKPASLIKPPFFYVKPYDPDGLEEWDNMSILMTPKPNPNKTLNPNFNNKTSNKK